MKGAHTRARRSDRFVGSECADPVGPDRGPGMHRCLSNSGRKRGNREGPARSGSDHSRSRHPLFTRRTYESSCAWDRGRRRYEGDLATRRGGQRASCTAVQDRVGSRAAGDQAAPRTCARPARDWPAAQGIRPLGSSTSRSPRSTARTRTSITCGGSAFRSRRDLALVLPILAARLRVLAAVDAFGELADRVHDARPVRAR